MGRAVSGISALMKRRHGLVARSLLSVFFVVLILASISSLVISNAVNERESQQAIKALKELVIAVANTASVAAFAEDEQLASEVVLGLMSNSDVLRATIRSSTKELASASRENGGLSSVDAPKSEDIVSGLASPFEPGEFVGAITLVPDLSNISKRIRQSARATLFVQIGEMALVVAITALIMFLLVVKPIKVISRRLHGVGANRGDLLVVPRGHRKSEIGQLVGDINTLTGRLFSTLEQERALQLQQLVASRKYQNLFDHAASGIFVANMSGELESFNRAFAALTWLPGSGRTESRSLSEVSWREPQLLLAMLRESLDKTAGGSEVEGDFVLTARRGAEHWLHVSLLALGDGSVQGTVSDITQLKQEELAARHQAVTDTLTGFSNRTGLQSHFETLSKDTPRFALAAIDLHGFKKVNEALGFHVGDKLLLKLSARLKKILTAGDSAARVDSDKFVLLLNGDHERGVVSQRVEKLLDLLRQPYDIGGTDRLDRPKELSIAASIGIAFFPADGGDLNDLLRSAELAINSAQDRSESSYYYFDPSQQAAVEHRRRLEDDLRHAIGANELQLLFQPIVDVNAKVVTGAEALLRWHHPTKGLISPEIFIPLAEQIGLIDKIGLMTIDQACRHVARWRADGMDIHVSINVSVKQIPNGLSPECVQQALERYELPPSAIVIEITEGVLMENIVVAQRWIENIHALGVRIYLDDFGTGYSSLSYLKRFSLDTVKIDKSFVRDLNADPSDRALVQAIIAMASSLGLSSVAEGVEDQQQLDLLSEMGCDYLQGYYFSRPVCAEEFAPSLLRINAQLTENTDVVSL